MRTATIPELVELLDAVRTGKGLLSRALPLPEGWERGVRFRSTGCVTPVLEGTCVIDDPPAPERVGEAVTFHPVLIRQSATCTTLSRVGPVDRANERLIGTTEWGLGRLLATGLSDLENPTLADAQLVTDAANVTDAMACLEQAIADVGYGNRAFIHASYRAATYMRERYLLNDQDRTAAGNQVIVSPGYPGAGEEVSIWATGPVWAAVGAVEGLDALNARLNNDEAWSQRVALVAFDPCINFTTTFTVPACTGGS